MPSYPLNGVIYDDPRRLEKIKFRVSPEGKAKGRKAFKDPVTGYTPTDEQFSLAEVVSLSTFPSSYIIPTPQVRSQGSEGSCVSWSLGYLLRSVAQYVALGSSSYNDAVNVMSPEYLFDYVALNSCQGSTALDNLDLMTNKGICLWATLPYTSGSCAVSQASPYDAQAADYKITGYFMLSTTDPTAVKTSLLNNQPLQFSFNVDTAFYNAGPGFIWSAATATGTIVGQHAIAIVGYDDSKNAYKVQNSWGTGWGDSGFGWIDYNYMPTVSSLSLGINAAAPTAPVATQPVANAGLDATVPVTGPLSLSGTSSYDPDGYLTTYLWSQLSGPNTATIASPNAAVTSVTGLAVGTYVFQLTVTDNSSNTATDTVSITTTSVDIATLSVTKTSIKGKATDHVTWSISSSVPVSAAEIKVTTSSSSDIHLISPYKPSGTWDNTPYYQKLTRYYQLKVTKSDGTITYSTTVSIR